MKSLTRPYRITCIRSLGGIGDALMLSPVFLGLKEKYPGCEITLATTWDYQSGALPQIFRNNPSIDQMVRVEPHEFATGFLKQNKWEFRGVENAHIPDCMRYTDLVMDFSTICAQTETHEMNNGGVRTHRTDIWCRAAGVNPSSKKPILVLTDYEIEEGRRWCAEHLGDGIRIGMPLKTMSGTVIGNDVRGWPHTDEFCFDLKRKGYQVLTIDPVRRVHDAIPALIGKPIRFVASIIANLDAVVTPDTGILHIAGALGVPVLGLFGSTDGALRMREYAGSYSEAKHLVPCAPCWYRTPCLRDPNPNQHVLCMQRLNREIVLAELEMMLERFGIC